MRQMQGAGFNSNVYARDEAARAAMTMAAVAQAASASNKSPAEAAEMARANALNIANKQNPQAQAMHMRQQQMRQQQQHQQMHGHRRGPMQQAPTPTVRPEPRKIQPVPLESVKSLLRSEIAANKASNNQNDSSTSSKLLEKLANGENDSLMQQLLLMEFLKDSEATTPESKNAPNSNSSEEAEQKTSTSGADAKSEIWKTTFACERVKFLLKQIETAYESMESMLPEVPQLSTDDDYGLDNNSEIPVTVPDILPPCTSKGGDNTLEFFRACSGETLDGQESGIEEGIEKLTTSSSMDSQKEGSTNSQDVDGDTKSLDFSESGATLSTSASSSSIFSNMFGMKRPSLRANRAGFLASFTKRNRRGSKTPDNESGNDENGFPGIADYKCEPGEYCVIIEREMLGLTVENVLERTVVRTVLEAGPAKKAGAKVGSLIVKVGNIETKNLTHFETIDELRQSQRPLLLVLRQIPAEALRAAREEMGRLIRGSGFGKIIDGEGGPSFPGANNANAATALHQTASNARTDPMRRQAIQNIGTYSGLLRKRWIEAVNLTPRSKKCEPILRVGEKLLWIMTLFVVGLEREAEKLSTSPSVASSQKSQHSHSAQDYADAAKSVSKIVFDFVQNRMDPSRITPPTPPPPPPAYGGRGRGRGRGPMGGRGGRGGRGMNVPGTNNPPPALSSDKLLTQIGDVLQRTRTFLADTSSPPAAMLRGELIACLCDILDADTEMKLSEEDNISSTQGEGTGPIADLGAAGSLLKLIILNCTVMRSLECDRLLGQEQRNNDQSVQNKNDVSTNQHRLHAGNRFLAIVHRLAASRSTSARITACSLGPVLWSRLDFPHQLQVRCAFLFKFPYLSAGIDLCTNTFTILIWNISL